MGKEPEMLELAHGYERTGVAAVAALKPADRVNTSLTNFVSAGLPKAQYKCSEGESHVYVQIKPGGYKVSRCRP
jgi:hypothetical protein